MKKTFIKLSALLVAIICSQATFAYDFSDKGIYYNLDASENAIVTSGEEKYSGDVDIPSEAEYNGKKLQVIGIGKEAFYSCSDLRSVTMHSPLKTIGEWAFYNCRKLYSVELPSTLTEIGNYAFALCSKLTEISLQSTSVKTIGGSAFSSSGLTSITIPQSVTMIESDAFSSCKDLDAIQVITGGQYSSPNNCNAIIKGNTLVVGCNNTNNIPETITTIGEYAFYGSNLESIVLPQAVKIIGEWAFYNCRNLSDVHLSDNLTAIDKYAFALCSKLQNITFPSSLKNIGGSAFSSSGVIEIDIPQSVSSIDNDAFSSCKALTSIKVLDGNTTYDSRQNCNAIIKISNNNLIIGCTGTTTIPDNVTAIGDNAFYGSEIDSITIPNSVTRIGEWAFYNCRKLSKIKLSNNLTYIDKYAFALCSELTEIRFPSAMKSIGSCAFGNCSKLLTIEALMTEPYRIDDDVFEKLYEKATLYVPTGATNAYMQKGGWKLFQRIQEKEFTGIMNPTIAVQRIYSDNGIIYIECASDGNCNIYSMSGQLMRTLALKKGTNTVSGLSKGVYIINGNKVLVK